MTQSDRDAPDAPSATDTLTPPVFDRTFQKQFIDLLLWRRDVRRFRTDPIPKEDIDGLIKEACLAPSVGNCQPWRFVKVNDPDRRKAIRDSFERANQQALNDYHGERARLYASLKLQGMDQAPIQLAVFADEETEAGMGLGRKTMPEMLDYSAVAAVQLLWLAARVKGIGVGWVSILEPETVLKTLDVPSHWRLIAYLCIGYPEEDHVVPELVREGWQDRIDPAALTLER
ncbi:MULTISPECIES: 5,6-dimethylbenzimidazole synthase [Thalassospira]|jgi:5,6-dimethylbenzimidazole synthase|uniref:5,6-dimethylbenzimidazole synthase n=1 Tax=Thalassospira xiamenensis TaxID=220697 RepID=A0ABR5Y299_9PROT|nr:MULTISPECIES: 5,6-dimethylbenzimidazole synthase [Thalassospira]KZD03298.1 5,6-dimethylbenzimidazole synthase [Thalassospira xiamenensis]KZD07717.1 5,6-dimethylbenzimidazole synthase [Thalassospira xiamenensis]MAB32884.1 5,6-dimethylbenzimidazole synthase [Thalassospira sp.]MCD1592897.1 5,6-dimethylbenzimidazole synthase [Thalassospira xiamenensis]MDM7974823.1 5,6-dimethylbenzimidazole synthase [Thalassospira xiamenensis]|tara:strand:- start:1572 stop:2261 length:690 start_codon:yes stop_codon:yes gene_type:complete